MTWRSAARVILGLGEAVLGVAGLAGWVEVTTVFSGLGIETRQPWQPDGLGLVVIGYCVLIVVAGIRLALGSTSRWLAWTQLSLCVALAVPVYLALIAPAGGGDPLFFGLVAGTGCVFLVLALVAGLLLLRKRSPSA